MRIALLTSCAYYSWFRKIERGGRTFQKEDNWEVFKVPQNIVSRTFWPFLFLLVALKNNTVLSIKLNKYGNQPLFLV